VWANNDQTEAALGPASSLQDRLFDLIRQDREMTSKPIEQLALVLISRLVSDQGAFGRLFSQFFDARLNSLAWPDPFGSKFGPGHMSIGYTV